MFTRQLLASLIVFGSILVSSDVSAANQLTTDFSGEMIVNGQNTSSLLFPDDMENHLVLPPALSAYDCRITPLFQSADGKSVYHNIACYGSSITFGASVSCDRTKADSDTKKFFLRTFNVNGYYIDVGFTGRCITH